MDEELKEKIQDLIYYYDHHTVDKMVAAQPGFVVDDFSKLLESLRPVVFN